MAYKRNRFGSIILTDGTTITKKEQKLIQNKVKYANQIRQKQLDKHFEKAREQKGFQNINKEGYAKLLEKKGFITEKYSANFSKLDGNADKRSFISELKQETNIKRRTSNKHIQNIRKSMNRMTNHNYNSEGKPVREMLKNMTDEELMVAYLHDSDLVKILYGSDQDLDDIEGLIESTIAKLEKYTNYRLPHEKEG